MLTGSPGFFSEVGNDFRFVHNHSIWRCERRHPFSCDSDVTENKELLDRILKGLKKKEEIEIVEGATSEKAGKKGKEEKASKGKKAKEPDDEDEDEDEDEDSDEDSDDEDSDEDSDDDEDEDDEEEEEKPAKKSKKEKASKDKDGEKKKGKGRPPQFAGAGGEGKPGIIASIQEFLLGASEDKPLTKKDLLKKLEERFPDRNSDSMSRTINVQVPNRLKVDKGLIVNKNDKGYWARKPKAGDDAEEASSKETKKAKKAKKAKKEEADEDDDD